MAIAPASRDSIDRTVVRIIDDFLDALELWHQAGCDDARWVAGHWDRTMACCLGVELPPDVRAAGDAHAVHAALLAWQTAVACR